MDHREAVAPARPVPKTLAPTVAESTFFIKGTAAAIAWRVASGTIFLGTDRVPDKYSSSISRFWVFMIVSVRIRLTWYRLAPSLVTSNEKDANKALALSLPRNLLCTEDSVRSHVPGRSLSLY